MGVFAPVLLFLVGPEGWGVVLRYPSVHITETHHEIVHRLDKTLLHAFRLHFMISDVKPFLAATSMYTAEYKLHRL